MVSIKFVSKVRYDITLGYYVTEKESEVIQCSAVRFDDDNVGHKMQTEFRAQATL